MNEEEQNERLLLQPQFQTNKIERNERFDSFERFNRYERNEEINDSNGILRSKTWIFHIIRLCFPSVSRDLI